MQEKKIGCFIMKFVVIYYKQQRQPNIDELWSLLVVVVVSSVIGQFVFFSRFF